jgi:hypothetical protein
MAYAFILPRIKPHLRNTIIHLTCAHVLQNLPFSSNSALTRWGKSNSALASATCSICGFCYFIIEAGSTLSPAWGEGNSFKDSAPLEVLCFTYKILISLWSPCSLSFMLAPTVDLSIVRQRWLWLSRGKCSRLIHVARPSTMTMLEMELWRPSFDGIAWARGFWDPYWSLLFITDFSPPLLPPLMLWQ